MEVFNALKVSASEMVFDASPDRATGTDSFRDLFDAPVPAVSLARCRSVMMK